MIGLRFVAYGAAGVLLVLAGIRRVRTRRRKPVRLPDWFGPLTAFPFGALLTAADLPNAFPYFISIERLIDADLTVGQGVLVLAGYALIYCLPCLVLLVIGLIARRRTRSLLERITTRFGTGEVKASPPIAILLILLGLGVGSLPFWALA